MPASAGQSGNYGQMSFTHYLDKMENTYLPEDEYQTENYMRQTLKDLSCDVPWLESDQKRERLDNPLTLRHHGARSSTQPDLPDGTFLDFHALEKDPRSLMVGPDFNKVKTHAYTRGKYLNFKNDNCPTISGEGIAPLTMVQNIKHGMHRAKDYMKNFDESLTGWAHNGGGNVAPLIKKSNVENCTYSSEMPSEDGPTQCTRQSYVTDADSILIGHASLPDQRLKIAGYGRVNPGKSMTDQNWYKNRSNAEFDAKASYTLYENKPVNTSDALAILDIVKTKQRNMNPMQNTNAWKNSSINIQTSGLTPGRDTVKQSQNASTSQTINAKLSAIGNRIKQNYAPDRVQEIGKTNLDKKVFNSILRTNSKQMIQDREKFNDLRNEIHDSSQKQTLNNVAQTTYMKNNVVNGTVDRFAGDAETVQLSNNKLKSFNFGSINPMTNVSRNGGQNDFDQSINGQHVLKTKKRILTSETLVNETEFNIINDIGHANSTLRKASTRMGEKNRARSYYDTDSETHNEVLART
jgi:hypothetical protein